MEEPLHDMTNENASLLTHVMEAKSPPAELSYLLMGQAPQWKPFGSHRISPMLRKFLTLTAPVTRGLAAFCGAPHSIYAPV